MSALAPTPARVAALRRRLHRWAPVMVSVTAVVRVGAIAGVMIVADIDRLSALVLIAVGAVGAVAMAVVVRFPGHRVVRLGHALPIAVAVSLPAPEVAVIVLVTSVVAAPITARRADPTAAWVLQVVLVVATAAAVGTGRVAEWALEPVGRGDALLLARVAAAGVAYVASERVVWRILTGHRVWPEGANGFELRAYLVVLCSAALLALGYGHDQPWMGAVAAIPVLVTRFSFERLVAARNTLDQTIQALGIVPELAGLTPFGHGERVAVYVDAITNELGLGEGQRRTVVTAARLHELGRISLPEPGEEHFPPDEADVGVRGAELLRSTGFLESVADTVAGVGRPDPESLLSAAICVASEFDVEVGSDPDRALGSLALLARAHPDGVTRQAVDALEQALDHQPDLVARAGRASAPLTTAAAEAHAD